MSEHSEQEAIRASMARTAHTEWLARAREILAPMLRRRRYYWVDLAWSLEEIGPPPGNNSDMGSISTHLKAAGLLKKSELVYSSKRANHKGVTVWESCVYEGSGDESLPPKTYKAIGAKDERAASLIFESSKGLYTGEVSPQQHVKLITELLGEHHD